MYSQPGQMAPGRLYGGPPPGPMPSSQPPTQQMAGLSMGPPPPPSSGSAPLMYGAPSASGPQQTSIPRYGPPQPTSQGPPSQPGFPNSTVGHPGPQQGYGPPSSTHFSTGPSKPSFPMQNSHIGPPAPQPTNAPPSQFASAPMQPHTGGLHGTQMGQISDGGQMPQFSAPNVASMAGPPPNPMQPSQAGPVPFPQSSVPPTSGQMAPPTSSLAGQMQSPTFSGQGPFSPPSSSGQAQSMPPSGLIQLPSSLPGQAPPISGQTSGQGMAAGQVPPPGHPPMPGQFPPTGYQTPPPTSLAGPPPPTSLAGPPPPTSLAGPPPLTSLAGPPPPTSMGGQPPISGQPFRPAAQTGMPQRGMQQGPPGVQQGPPGMQQGPPGMQQGPPGMQLGPPGMQQGPPGMQHGPPGMQQMHHGPPGMHQGPPGMQQGPPGMQQMQQGPPGMLHGPPGMQQMQQGPPGMQHGPPGMQQMHHGPPGMQQGPPGMQQMHHGPPGMQQGPPGMQQMHHGPPGMQQGPPGMQHGPPGMQHGPPGMQQMHHGPPGMATAPIQQQPRQRIDPDQMPNPVAVMKLDQDQRGRVLFRTSTRGVPPPFVTTNFTAQDDGNCSPRYMRATMYTVPCSKDLLNSCRVPMGLVVQPLADIPPQENNLRLVDHGPGGPIRCNRCKAYMNPFARFIDGGRQYLCPVCECSNEVPPEYFCHLDHQGRRTDTLQRPELCFGTVEYVATNDYCKEGKLPKPPAYIFMIDVSFQNIQNGILSLLSQTILGLLESLPGSEQEGGSAIQVGFVTYDKVIHFYNTKASLAQPQMMVLTDVGDVFVPLVDGFLVSPSEAKTVLESLLSQLPEMFSNNKTPQVILEPVVRAGMEALKAAGRSGRLFVFHSSLPTAQGPGTLKNRVDSKLLGTEKEKTLLSPVSSPYQKLAEECVKYGVGVELFLLPTNYADVATLGHFVSSTGGELHYYKHFQANRDGDRLLEDLKHSLTRTTAFDGVMRVRASTGLRPTGFYGAFFMSNTTDIELGNIDTDKAIAVEIKHDDKLKEDDIVFFQAALLFTDLQGNRRLRIHNLALNCSTKYQDLYRSCEVDTIVNFFSKSVTKASLSMPYKAIRENFSRQCAIILSSYRKHCSNQSPPGQLILPESLKLLPMYANCLLKSDALLSPPIVSLDEKCWLMIATLSMTLHQSVAFFYPKMMALHDVDVDSKAMPATMRCTGQKLQETGVYLIENGFVVVVWVGQQVGVDFISKVFGAPSHAQINTDMYSLPALDNPLSFRVRGILSQIQEQRQYTMKLHITRQRDKTEVIFRRMLKEDKGAGQWEGTSYIDFLCQIHRDIKEILS